MHKITMNKNQKVCWKNNYTQNITFYVITQCFNHRKTSRIQFTQCHNITFTSEKLMSKKKKLTCTWLYIQINSYRIKLRCKQSNLKMCLITQPYCTWLWCTIKGFFTEQTRDSIFEIVSIISHMDYVIYITLQLFNLNVLFLF